MKNRLVKSCQGVRWASLALCASATIATQVKADSIVTFSVDMSVEAANGHFVPGTDTVAARGTFNGYGQFFLVQSNSTDLYTNTLDDATDANGTTLQYKFWDSNSGGWESTADGANRAALLPTNSGAILVLPTPVFGDAGAAVTNIVNFQVDVSQEIALGNFTPGSSLVEVRGEFNGWAGGAFNLTPDPTISVTNQYGLVTSNVWTGSTQVIRSPASAEAFKYVIQPGTIWDSPIGGNADGGGNRYFANVAQTLPLVNFADLPYAPLCTNMFNVDTSVVALTDTNFNPATVTMWGTFNGWGSGVPMTNNPTAPNTNIYTISTPVVGGVGSTIQYQYRYTQFTGGTVYDHYQGANGGNNNRSYTVPNLTDTNVPAVVFNDAELDDYLTQPTAVFFSVDMNGAVGTDAHTFNPASDTVYINGQFDNWYAWASGVNPTPAPPGYEMFEQGLSTIYTNTVIIPAGTTVSFNYKYGMDPGAANGGPLDDEAASGQNHYRVVRSTAQNPYVTPTDKFGTQYGEPLFNIFNTAGGQLTIGAVSGGTIPVTWLGRPGAELQVNSSLTGVWQTIAATDGTNWTIGYISTNGFVSQTNYPVSGNQYFRLVKP